MTSCQKRTRIRLFFLDDAFKFSSNLYKFSIKFGLAILRSVPLAWHHDDRMGIIQSLDLSMTLVFIERILVCCVGTFIGVRHSSKA